MRSISLSVILLLFFPIVAAAQLPSIHSLRNTYSGRDQFPFTITSADGGFYIYNYYEGAGDSLFASVTRLGSDLEPQWNRILKMRWKLVPSHLFEDTDGSLVLSANANSNSSQYYQELIRISSSGDITNTREIVDSTNGYAVITHRLSLQNGSEILIGNRGIAHINPQGAIDFSKQPYIMNDPFKTLNIRGAAAVPGTNFWIGVGAVDDLCFYSRWEDTTLVSLRVFDTGPVNALGASINTPYIYSNQDVVYSWQDGVERLHLSRLSPDGSIIWWKTYNIHGCNPARLKVDSNGELWVTGSITPGQAGGIVAHFSSTGEYINHKGQFTLGYGMTNISGFEPMPNGEYFTLQSGYAAPYETLFLNHIQSNLIFQCHDAQVPALADTAYTIVDSAVVNFGFVERTYSISQEPSYPLTVINSTVIKSDVVCTPTGIAENEAEEKLVLFPNPATQQVKLQGLETGVAIRLFSADGRLVLSEKYKGNISLNSLREGLYVIEVPEKNIRLRLIKGE